MADNPILDKIKKLFALASSDNEHEAGLALARAMELMDKYGIEKADLQDDPYAKQEFERNGASTPIEQIYIFTILEDYFHVRCILCPSPSWHKKNHFMLVGQEHHRLMASYVYDFLLTAFRGLWKTYRKGMNKRLKAKTVKNRHHQYLHGLMNAVMAKLRKQRQAMDAEGLVRIDDAKLDDWFEQNIRGLSSKEITTNVGKHTYDGMRDGKNIDINKPLAQGSENKQLTGGVS